MRSALLLLLIALHTCACAARQERPLEIATTTSVVNSGLLDFVLRGFEHPVRVHAAGSGRSLAMLADQIVDLVISHAPESEARSLADHPDWRYRKLAYNHFVILGPPSDPADVRHATDAVDAFRRIAARDAIFVSRGDQPGRMNGRWRSGKTRG
jgi:tungstate transport system substrate-binding protein